MVNKNKLIYKFFLIISIFILSSFLVSAAPGVPNQFYGTVTVNGASAPNNLFVEARVGSSVFTTITSNGLYGDDPNIFYIEDPANNRQGQTIRFYVGTSSTNMVEAQSSTFSNGAVTKLDLSVSGLTIPSNNVGDDSTGGTTGGTGGAGGGTTESTTSSTTGSSGLIVNEGDNSDDGSSQSTSRTNSLSQDVCEPNWVCGEWTECINFQQRRVCVDANDCGLNNSPETRRGCVLTPEELEQSSTQEEPKESFVSRFTGFVTGDTGGIPSIIPLIALVTVIAGLFIFLFTRNNKKVTKKRKNR